MDQLYEEFNKKWKSTSRILFGEEVGELNDFKKWLIGNRRVAFERKSFQSGKGVLFVLPYYSKDAKVISMDEVDLGKKFSPLNINEIKDIDSIVEAVKERILYTGNTYLGESKNLSESTDVVSSSYVFASTQVSYSKWVSYCYNFEYCEHLFGCQHLGYSAHCIRSSAADYLTRCFEVISADSCQDCYYCASTVNCKNCLFSFGLRNATHCVGNLQLSSEEYLKIKNKLLEDLATDLKAKKSLINLEEFFGTLEPDLVKAKVVLKNLKIPKENPDKKTIEEAFSKTAKVVLGKELVGLDNYGSWLKEHIRDIKIRNSVLSRQKMFIPDYSSCYLYPENRLINEQEIIAAGQILKITLDDLKDFSLKNAPKIFNNIAFFCSSENHGKISNNIESEINISCQNFYKSILNTQSKYGAFNFYGLQSEYLFGTHSLRKSMFCIRCYLSANLTRCFEVDSSRNCSDCYFCHNCENLRDSMFCFNVKNLSYAIGNVELPKEEYLKIKKIVLDSIAKSLEQNSTYPINIFNLSNLSKNK